MRPQRRFREVGQLRLHLRCGQADRRQRPAGAQRGRRDLRALDDDEHEPRAQMAGGVGARRREQPRKVGRIEVDDREVVGLEVGDVRPRVGAHDQALIDADHVGRAVEREVDVAGHGGGRVAVLLGLQRQADRDARPRRERAARGIGVGCARARPRRDQGMKR